MAPGYAVNVLAVGAHHDDLELGCGGTLALLAAGGHSVFGTVLTDSETHFVELNLHRTAEQALAEARKAAEVVGYRLIDLGGAKARNGELRYDVQSMRHLEAFVHAQRIDVLFCHWTHDLNTDHAAAATLATVAGRHVPTVLMYRSNGYETGQAFHGTFSVDISSTFETKARSLECYTGEIANRGRAWITSFLDHNRTCGLGLGVAAAEVFEPQRFRWSPAMLRSATP